MRLLAISTLILAACHQGPPPAFYWDTGDLLGSGTDITTGIAAGSRAAIKFTAYDVTFAESSDPRVAKFDLSGDVYVTALAPGYADLILRNARGVEVDRATVRVVPTVDLAIDVATPEAVRVLEGASTTFHVATLGPGGEGTVGIGAVSFAASGTAVQEDKSIWDYGDTMRFHGAAGWGRLTAMADSASATLDVEFVPAASVARLDWSSIDLGAGQIDVTFTASSSAGPIYGAIPACTASDASVEFGSADSNPLAESPAAVRRFSLTKRGKFTADRSEE